MDTDELDAPRKDRQKHGIKLTPAADQLMKTFFTKNAYPTQQEKAKLLAQIQATPGNEGYTASQLNNKFANLRQVKKHRRTLDSANIQSLQELTKTTPFPSKGVISIWAKGMDVPPSVIENWLASQKASYRPLTPAESTSPEPGMDYDISLEPKIESPSIPHTTSSYLPSPVITEPQSGSVRSLPRPPPKHTQKPPSFQTDVNYLLKTISQAFKDPPPEHKPRTAEEFEKLFADHRIDQFVHDVANGSYRDFGFHPNMISPPSP